MTACLLNGSFVRALSMLFLTIPWWVTFSHYNKRELGIEKGTLGPASTLTWNAHLPLCSALFSHDMYQSQSWQDSWSPRHRGFWAVLMAHCWQLRDLLAVEECCKSELLLVMGWGLHKEGLRRKWNGPASGLPPLCSGFLLLNHRSQIYEILMCKMPTP